MGGCYNIHMFRIVWDKPEIGVGDEVHNLLKRPTKKEREQRMVWTHRERVLVGIILTLTILASVYFWYKGQGTMPNFQIPSINFGGFGLNQTVILEK